MDSKKYTSTPEHHNMSPPRYSLRNSTPIKRNLKFDEDSGKKSRKRKRMKNIINNIEKEIEEQLDQNDFTTNNVSAIVKEVIRDEDVREMVRNTLHPGDSSKCYEPKLTRAKVRELLKNKPDLSLPILWPMRAQNTNFVSECLSLINEDFSENSSGDEEYKPDDDDNKSEYADSCMPSEYGGSERGLNDSFEVFDAPRSVDTDVNRSDLEENICQRTRSKLPLTETPLEVIEQRFHPPDITIDMYETECDNEDYRHFIQESVQPIDQLIPEPNDDLEDDPEYIIQADEEKVDREELREDKAVDIPDDEVQELILELLREHEAFSNIKTTETSVTSQQPTVRDESDIERPEKAPTPPPVVFSKPNIPVSECPIITDSQKLLLGQQIRQHVQLTLTHFLQCHKHPTLFRLADEMKTNLEGLQYMAGLNKKSTFYASNLDDALKLVKEWEEIRADVPKPKTLNFLETRKKSKNVQEFAPDFMKVVCKSKAFLYPLMLPKVPFDSRIERNVRRRDILPSEEWLLTSGLQQFTEFVKNTKKNSNGSPVNVMWETLKLIIHYLLPHFTPSFLYRLIKTHTSKDGNNYLKYYDQYKRAPPLKHYVIPVNSKKVCQQSFELLHPVWEDYIKKNFLVVTPVQKAATNRSQKKKTSDTNISS